jgi:phage-related protein
MAQAKFQVLFMEDAARFLELVEPKAREKILFNIRKAQIVTDNELFKKLNDDLWEFRTLFNKTHYRLFAFWDKTERSDTLVISTHGIVKKTDKTPLTELNKANQLRKLYFDQKAKRK